MLMGWVLTEDINGTYLNIETRSVIRPFQSTPRIPGSIHTLLNGSPCERKLPIQLSAGNKLIRSERICKTKPAIIPEKRSCCYCQRQIKAALFNFLFLCLEWQERNCHYLQDSLWRYVVPLHVFHWRRNWKNVVSGNAQQNIVPVSV